MSFSWKVMQKWGRQVGREGMSRAAIQAVEEFDGSYKGAIKLAGRMKAIAEAAKCDDYWSEKMQMGYSSQLWSAKIAIGENPYD